MLNRYFRGLQLLSEAANMARMTSLLICIASVLAVAIMSNAEDNDANLAIAATCTSPTALGMETGLIRDKDITASSWLYYNTDVYGPQTARLNAQPFGGWVKHDSDNEAWIQVDLTAVGVITGLQIQGGIVADDKRVTEFSVKAGTTSCNDYIKNADGSTKVFQMTSHDTQTFTFSEPIAARYIRIMPKQCNEYCALRFEIFGCLETFSECYSDANGQDYRGHEDVTTTGQICQKWTSQSPHSHSFTPEEYPNTGLGDHNYCRNPDDDQGPWCITTDPDDFWGYCDVGDPQESCQGTTLFDQTGNAFAAADPPTPAVCQSPVAFGMETGEIPGSYITASTVWNDDANSYGSQHGRLGNANKRWVAHGSDSSAPWIQVDLYGATNAVSGVITQGSPNNNEWVSSFKVRVGTEECDLRYIVDSNNNPVVFIGNSDRSTKVTSTFPSPVSARYVRIEPLAWQYTVSLRFEVLGCFTSTPPSTPPVSECYSDAIGRDYRGHEDVTTTGQICQKWTSQSPHGHSFTPENYQNTGLGDHNYCRNPDDDQGGPWCITTDADDFWSYCDVGDPQESCQGTTLFDQTENAFAAADPPAPAGIKRIISRDYLKDLAD